jgi:hypothetical protein
MAAKWDANQRRAVVTAVIFHTANEGRLLSFPQFVFSPGLSPEDGIQIVLLQARITFESR